jgi:probable F420-dependent oxidoreductase
VPIQHAVETRVDRSVDGMDRGSARMKVEMAITSRDFTAIGEASARLEAQGLDCGIIFESSHDPFMQVLLSAQQTARLSIATGVAIAFARSPMIVAQTASDLQALSAGRFILGLGSQIKPHIEKRFSMPWSKPAARMREYVAAMRAIWQSWESGERLNFRGEFYTHTLMTPVFSPGPNPFGTPPVFVAGVGPKMIEVAGEVGDGMYVHPLNTPAYVADVVLPRLAKGFEIAGRKRIDFEISCQTITMMGGNDEQIQAARNKAKGQISFYGSTPAYKVVLDHMGVGDIHPELNRLSKEGKWLEMMGLISDDMLEEIGVSGTPAEVGAKLAARNGGFADRTMITLYDETADRDAVSDLVGALRGALP